VRSPHLRPGDSVRIVAASGPVPRDDFETGAKLLAERYRLRYDPATLFRAQGFLAGPDSARLEELTAAIADPEARAVFMARGGYGLLRLLPFLDPALLEQNPKPIVGFSDVTALLAYAARAGVAAIHGPTVTQLSRLPEEDRADLYGMLERPLELDGPRTLLSDLDAAVPGRVKGRLLGGNLEVFSRLVGTPYLPDLRGAVLFFEDTNERPYRIDRLLTHLDLAGVFNLAAAVVVGDFSHCDDPARQGSPSPPAPVPSARDVIEDRLGRLASPVALGARFGHGDRNQPLPYGTLVELDTRYGTLVALEGVVS
jgi:muramoyltetrapeptide carboxypeptidase